jgi:hypothetical protein
MNTKDITNTPRGHENTLRPFDKLRVVLSFVERLRTSVCGELVEP